MSTQFSGHKLSLIRGERCLFRNLSFALEAGELLLLEGRNGSGKTSLLKAIVGLLELEEGEFHWQGKPVVQHRQAFLQSTVWLAHRTGLKADLTPIENLRFESALRPVRSDDIEAALERLGVLRLRKLPLRALSAGQQRRVALARLVLSGARIWLMDEPFTNLDKEGRELLENVLSDHFQAGGLCIMAAHQDVPNAASIQRVHLS